MSSAPTPTVINPYTGRQIKIGGATYNKIYWRDLCPYSQSERQLVAQKCSAETYFLRLDNLGYPVCLNVKTGTCTCPPHCLGINAAYKRAIQCKVDVIATKALRLKSKYNCNAVNNKPSI
jgi:hypothetical protein